MRTRQEEQAGFRELLWRQHQGRLKVYRDTDHSFEIGGATGRAALARYGHYPVDDGNADYGVCILHRGVLAHPDNVLGGCADCYAEIEWRRTLRPDMARLCVFCALRRMGD